MVGDIEEWAIDDKITSQPIDWDFSDIFNGIPTNGHLPSGDTGGIAW